MYNRGRIMTNEERDILYKWATEHTGVYKISNGRIHYELKNREDTSIHPLVWEIKDRIIKKESLEYYEREPFLIDFLAIIPKGGFIQKHRDGNKGDLLHTRFNVFINAPKEGTMKTYYGGELVDAEACCYVLSRSGIDEHWTDINTSEEPRIALSFGYILPHQKVDELASDTSIGKYKLYPLGGIKMYNRGQIITEEERVALRDWIIGYPVIPISHSRFDATIKEDDPSVIPLIWDIKKRIEMKENIESTTAQIKPRVFLGIVPKGANIPKHTDENNKKDDEIQIRFNVFIQLPKKGCYTYYAGNLVDAKESCYVLCRSGVDEHWTSINQEDTARLSISYGYMLSKKKIDELTSDKSIGTYIKYPLAK